MLDRQLYTPISIVLAGSLIGVGLFMGLRQPGGSRVEPAAPAAGGQPAATAAQQPVGAPPVGAPRAAEPTLARRATEQALEAQRAAIVERCIPVAARSGAASRLNINITFDPSGRQIARGIISDRGDPRPALSECVTGALPRLQIPAPGALQALEVVWVLP